MKKKIIIPILAILLLFVIFSKTNNNEIRTIKSEKELYKLYNQNGEGNLSFIEKLLTLPFSIFIEDDYYHYHTWGNINYSTKNNVGLEDSAFATGSIASKDYSKTNIQVEGVDEADILKTDGDYIYSISENKVIITNVIKPEDPKIESTISNINTYPSDLLLYNNNLVIISTKISDIEKNNYRYNNNTIVEVYDLKDKTKPKLLKSFELQEPYYTTRCIDGKLYIFSKGYLREENNKISTDYKEDNKNKKINKNNIHYLKNHFENYQTLIAELDLNNIKDIKLSSYLIDISNAYISKNNIYLLNQDYTNEKISIKSILGWKGVFGLIDTIDYNYNYDEKTKIYKFNINNKKGVTYQTNTIVDGRTINQYSLDELDGNLRIALETNDGTRIAILDKNLKLLGETEKLEKNEKMYASRFIGNKAYLVTYKNTDPLFVIDLSNPKHPKVLGELKIPGYSTYLHPYDENHLIGIGMDTKEVINKDSNGKVTSSWTTITGMKMCLFDVSDITNPKEIDKTVIGDSRTVSAILTNPKALLFSKEKELLAIPVNNYQEDFSVKNVNSYDEEIETFKDKNNYISEGYFVYHIDLKGFKLKGVINHEKNNNKTYYYYPSKLLRGLYIEDNLYTVSETNIKINRIEDLKEINTLKIKKGEE